MQALRTVPQYSQNNTGEIVSFFKKITSKAAEQLERDLEDNPLDKIIVEKGDHPEVDKVYQARWVWYHTILAGEIFFTNVFLLIIIVLLIVIIGKI